MARALERSPDPAIGLTRLQAQLRAAYAEVGENLAHNTALQVLQQDRQSYMLLSPLPAQEESDRWRQLRAQLAQ